MRVHLLRLKSRASAAQSAQKRGRARTCRHRALPPAARPVLRPPRRGVSQARPLGLLPHAALIARAGRSLVSCETACKRCHGVFFRSHAARLRVIALRDAKAVRGSLINCVLWSPGVGALALAQARACCANVVFFCANAFALAKDRRVVDERKHSVTEEPCCRSSTLQLALRAHQPRTTRTRSASIAIANSAPPFFSRCRSRGACLSSTAARSV